MSKREIIEFNPTFEQWSAFQALDFDNPEKVEVLFGGAKGGGKTHFACMWIYSACLWLIERFKLPQTDNPPHIGFMGRKQSVDFTGTTLKTWRRTIPQSAYEIKGGSDKEIKHILIDGRVAVDFGGLDRTEVVSKFNSAEYWFIFIDQAEETTEDDVDVLKASRRLTINGKSLPYRGLWTANPRQCWLKEKFITNPEKNHTFVQALPSDNPHLPENYIDTLKDSFSHRPELLKAYLYGDWDVLEGAEQIVKSEWLRLAKNRSSEYWPVIKRYLVCDPARYGDDETVILQMYNSEIEDKVIMPYCPTTQISGKLASMSRQEGNIPVVAESVGADLGAGVIDELTELEVDVIGFNPASAASEPEKYYNLRAEAWSKVARIMATGILDSEQNIVFVLQNSYDTLEHQLCSPQYKFKTGKILVEAKEDIKKRLGRSPDHADTYVIALWAWDMIEPQVDEESVIRYRDKRSKAPSAMCM